MTTNGFIVCFERDSANIFSSDKNMIAQGIKQTNNLIRMLIKSGITLEANYAKASLQTWHERLGHVNRNSIEKMVRKRGIRYHCNG